MTMNIVFVPSVSLEFLTVLCLQQVRYIKDTSQLSTFQKGEVLVADTALNP